MGGKTHLIKANNRFNEHNKYQKLNVNNFYVYKNKDYLNATILIIATKTKQLTILSIH
jgi:hypothetical protein